MNVLRYIGVVPALAIGIMAGCATGTTSVDPMKNYSKALSETEPRIMGTVTPGSAREAQAIARFTDFYRVYSEEVIKSRVRELYAENAYFRDPFREVIGIKQIEPYFLSSTETVHRCTFDISEVAVKNGNYYFRWVMNLTLKRNKEKTLQAVGMSHVRFGRDGKVTFQQDYWDINVLYEELPVIRHIVKRVKKSV
jgi:steroid delta-isomerase